jgi:hypothetical protein
VGVQIIEDPTATVEEDQDRQRFVRSRMVGPYGKDAVDGVDRNVRQLYEGLRRIVQAQRSSGTRVLNGQGVDRGKRAGLRKESFRLGVKVHHVNTPGSAM